MTSGFILRDLSIGCLCTVSYIILTCILYTSRFLERLIFLRVIVGYLPLFWDLLAKMSSSYAVFFRLLVWLFK